MNRPRGQTGVAPSPYFSTLRSNVGSPNGGGTRSNGAVCHEIKRLSISTQRDNKVHEFPVSDVSYDDGEIGTANLQKVPAPIFLAERFCGEPIHRGFSRTISFVR